jgi:hypothetical protein
MGMDAYGIKPTSKRGQYFGAHNSFWYELASYCQEVAPEITSRCQNWVTNDGDGLDAAGAVALADALQKEIEAGRTDAYARHRWIDEPDFPPNKPCCACGGSGARKLWLPDLQGGGFKCDACDGSGHIHQRPQSQHEHEPWTEEVAAFAEFLRESGGFQIL